MSAPRQAHLNSREVAHLDEVLEDPGKARLQESLIDESLTDLKKTLAFEQSHLDGGPGAAR